jgi:hypothetical protein
MRVPGFEPNSNLSQTRVTLQSHWIKNMMITLVAEHSRRRCSQHLAEAFALRSHEKATLRGNAILVGGTVMRRTKLLAALVAILAVMAFGAGAAQAYWGWYWNAEIDVEGTDLRTAWTVVGGDSDDYFADIRVSVPRGADADVIDVADHERVSTSARGSLSCDSGSVETVVTFKVSATDKDADENAWVEVELTANGDSIGTAAGRVGKRITVRADVPATDPDC